MNYSKHVGMLYLHNCSNFIYNKIMSEPFHFKLMYIFTAFKVQTLVKPQKYGISSFYQSIKLVKHLLLHEIHNQFLPNTKLVSFSLWSVSVIIWSYKFFLKHVSRCFCGKLSGHYLKNRVSSTVEFTKFTNLGRSFYITFTIPWNL